MVTEALASPLWSDPPLPQPKNRSAHRPRGPLRAAARRQGGRARRAGRGPARSGAVRREAARPACAGRCRGGTESGLECRAKPRGRRPTPCPGACYVPTSCLENPLQLHQVARGGEGTGANSLDGLCNNSTKTNASQTWRHPSARHNGDIAAGSNRKLDSHRRIGTATFQTCTNPARTGSPLLKEERRGLASIFSIFFPSPPGGGSLAAGAAPPRRARRFSAAGKYWLLWMREGNYKGPPPVLQG
jgi:hypothetical protein